MANIPQTTYSNIPAYPKSWYQASGNWGAKTVTVAADRYKLTSPTAMQIDVNNLSLTSTVATEPDLSLYATWDTITPTDYTEGAARAGKDFYIYACIGTTTVPVIVISANATYPEGYTALTSRKIGGFHCLCASAGTLYSTWVTSTAYTLGQTVIPTVTNGYQYRCIANGTSAAQPTWPTTIGTTVGTTPQWICEPLHPLNNYLTGDILPTSVWDLKKRCKNIGYNNNGLAYIAELDSWAYIYLPSGSSTAPVSVFNGTILDTVDWNTCVDAGRVVGMKLLRDGEFQVAAALSNEQTNIYGSDDPVTTGGHVDTAGRRMISKYGLEDCCGAMYQWLDEGSYRFDIATAHYHKIAEITGGIESPTSGNAVAVDGTTAQDIAPAWEWKDLPLDKGQLYRQGAGATGYGDVKVVAGGAYTTSSNSGSREREHYYWRWTTNPSISFRLVSPNVWR